MKLKGILLTTALTAMLGVGVFAGVSGNRNEPVEKAEAAASTTKNTDATGIHYVDSQGWCFRSLHFYNVSYSDGYARADFETFLTGFYGAKINSWANQGTTRGWGYNGGTAGDFMICDGGSQTTHDFVFPWWVSSFTFQIVNNDNWLCNWGVHSGWGIHTQFDLKVDGTTVTTNSMDAFTYDFPAVTISKVAVDSSIKQVIAGITIPSETTSIYDKYPNGANAPADPSVTVDGYLFDAWFTNQDLTSAFSKKFYTSDATIYAKFDECPTTPIYVNSYNWSNLYVYTFETISDKNVEYYGPFPGKKISITDSGLKFNNGQLQKIMIPYTNLSNAKFIYSDGTDSNKSSDYSVTTDAYYWHNGSTWTKDSTHYASAASFVWELNTARLAVPAGGNVKAFSICGLNASSWVSRYDGLNATARGYIDSASMFTYKDKTSTGADTTVTFAEVINELRAISTGVRNSSLATLPSGANATVTTTATIVVSVMAISTAAGFVFLKKKKITK